MLIVMKADATEAQIAAVVDVITELGFKPHPMPGATRTAIGITGNQGSVDTTRFENLPGVAEAIRVSKPYKLITLDLSPDKTIVRVGDATIGDGELALIAGPCAIESREQAFAVAEAVSQSGARFFRGGAFKPRTSPYAFQGLGEDGLKILAEVREAYGLKIVTEALDEYGVDQLERYSDMIQIGARNMQNFMLLAEVGRADKPILIKRGPSASVEELLMAAEYVAREGNERIILCERGIKTFEQTTRYTLDLGSVAVLKRETHLPVIVDPSHAAGRRDLVLPLARAAAAVGADGIIVESHPSPEEALCDGPQQIPTAEFGEFAREVREVAELLGKRIG